MTSAQIRQRFLDFFANRSHAILPSASLVPKNDPSVLFNTAGMQPLVPYLMGEPHSLGQRLASCQKCVRTGDIDEVGNNKNLTFFEMLGNWSLGDPASPDGVGQGGYFKKEAIGWSYEFLTSKEEGLGLDPARLYVTVFEGDNDAPRDLEAVEIWKRYIPENRIYFLPKENNWWSPGENGPCGPDTEMFYDVTGSLGDMSHEEYVAADERGDVVEIWNDVFMEYEKKNGSVVEKLKQKNVDTGSGLERISMIVSGKSNVYETDLLAPGMAVILAESVAYNERSARIICDHIRTAVFMLGDGVLPSNKDQGYVLRRLIRRAVLQANNLSLVRGTLIQIAKLFQEIYEEQYPELKRSDLLIPFEQEEEKFKKTLEAGLKEFEKGADPFILATTYGFPVEMTMELAKETGIVIDRQKFDIQLKAHQEASRSGAEQKFKGGLANNSEQTTKLHTAHHLLLAALQQVLGKEVKQKGSNITDERLRIDFGFERKMTDEEKTEVEKIVNEAIASDYTVVKREMPLEEAEKIGAEMEFGTKYPDIVSIYFIEDQDGNHFSKEFCGGPHVTHTGILGIFKIQKEEAVASGIRRIKATLI